MRLNRFLSQAGIASRRKADILIENGRIAVNGRIVTRLGVQIDEAKDKVAYDGKVVEAVKQHIYLMLHKPVSYLVTVSDKFGRPTILALLPKFHRLVRPVGRLDLNSSGLLLLTNDGDLAFRLTHPRQKIDKVYIVKCKGYVDDNEIAKLESGVTLETGPTAPAHVVPLERAQSLSVLRITIHEGKKRQVRLMCRAVGHSVLELKRVGFGNLRLGDLEEGKFRPLTDSELKGLRRLVKL
jgi:pseudouridine synthase